MEAPEDSRLSNDEIHEALAAILDAYPEARIAAVGPDGRFCDLPDEVPVGDHDLLSGRAGIDLVAPESVAIVLDQFRHLAEQGATEVEVRAASGNPARYALFDTTERYGVVLLVMIEGEPDGGDGPAVTLAEMAPVRSRFGRVRRTDVGEYIEADQAMLDMLGYRAEEFAALDTASTVHPDDYPGVISQWFDLLTLPAGTARRSQVRYRRGDGSYVWVELTLTNNLDDPEQPHILSEMVDISDQMAAIDQVWHSQELLHRLTEALPLGVLQIDRDRSIVYANERLPEVVGTPIASTLAEQFVHAVDEGPQMLEEGVESVLSTGTDLDLELRLGASRSYALRYCQVAVRPLFDRDETVTGAVLCVSDVTDSTRMRKELEVRAAFDPLTQCYNRATVMSEIERSLEHAGRATAIVFVDLDDFKPVNDRLGHAAGDQLLRVVADALRRVVRSNDVVGRLGGDEFIVLCPDVPDQNRVQEIAERIAAALRFDADVGEEVAPVRASIGVAWTSATGVSAERLLAAADAAMYESKRERRNRPVLAPEVVDARI
ncbi:MAG: diguanylate cyclase domain-containing protein [Acidimicrobiales bacterium]